MPEALLIIMLYPSYSFVSMGMIMGLRLVC